MTRRAAAKRATTKNEHRAQLRALSRAMRDVHKSLIEFSRERYELENGPARGKGQLLDLLLNDEAFTWLRPLSRYIVAVDELVARRPAPSEEETARIRADVEHFISPEAGADAFGGRYTALLASEPKVATQHGALRMALRDMPEPERATSTA
jgi:hypothetical protein